jgi:hypothetical protein
VSAGTPQSINRSVCRVTPVWSTGHPPHTATELCPSRPPSPRSSSDLQLCPPFELIFSRRYSVVPSSWTLCGFQTRAVRFTSAWGFRNVCPNRLQFLRLISSSTGTWAVLLHTSWLLTASGYLSWRILPRHRLIKICSCVVIFLDSLAYNKTDLTCQLKVWFAAQFQFLGIPCG